MMKRIGALLLALAMLLSAAMAEDDRYAQLFDTSNDGGKLTIRFLDLGPMANWDRPGDSMIITSPDGKTMLLDTGNYTATDYVRNALDAMGITHLDCILISHPHTDHMDGLPAIMDEYGADIVYTSNVAWEYGLNRWETEHIILHEGMQFRFGGHVTVDVYNPPAEIVYPEAPDGIYGDAFYNDLSLALKFTYGASAVMLAGDLYTAGERQVVERWGADALDCDVMKANHHGASTSSSNVWLDAVSPQISVVMRDMVADQARLRKLEKRGEAYHTLHNGNIRISTVGDGSYEVFIELTEKRLKR